MPPSPVKRVTRSRAATSNVAGDVFAAASGKVGAKTSSSKRAKQVSGSAQETPNPAKREVVPPLEDIAPAAMTTRRKIKVTPLEPKSTDNAEIKSRSGRKAQSQPKEAIAAKKPAKPKCDTDPVLEDNVEPETATKRKPRKKRDEDLADNQIDAPSKKRGRTARATSDKAMEKNELVPKPTRQTRTRAASQSAEAASNTTSVKTAVTAARKKVTFQDLPDSDKENRISQVKKSSKRGPVNAEPTGLRAKPVRRAPAVNASNKSAASTKQKPQTEKTMPLSPKKITQVARSASPENSDDELNGSKTPVRDLSLSPKRNLVKTGTSSPMRKLDFENTSLAQSSTKALASSAITSPARRPPTSPFKDALKASPKRGDMALVFPSSPPKASSISLAATSAPLSQSILLQSPKRGPLNPSVFAHSAMKPPRSTTKATLLQSPARRFLSPVKADVVNGVAEIRGGNTDGNKNDTSDLSPETTITSHFRPSQSPMRSHKVHQIRDGDLAVEKRDAVDFDESVLDIRSPIKLPTSLVAPEPSTEQVTETSPTPNVSNTITQVVENRLESADGHGGIDLHQSMDWSPEPIHAASTRTSATSTHPSYRKETFHLNPSIFENEGDSSEDELQVDTTTIFNFASATPGSSAHGSRNRLSTVNPADTSKSVAFTPLAKKLSGWLASSPDKTVKNFVERKGIFSPAAAQHVPGKVQVSRQSTPLRHSPLFRRNSPMTTTPSISTPAMTGASLSPGKNESPMKSSFFADEMVVKDLEQELEEKQVALNEVTTITVNNQAMDIQPITEEAACIGDMLSENITQLVADSAFSESVNQEQAQITTESGHGNPGLDSAFAGTEPENEDQTSAADDLGTFASTELEQDESQLDSDTPAAWDTAIPGQTRLDGEPKPAQVALQAFATPSRPNLAGPRYVNTVVSKVPLRPEGDISPIKIPKKRTRSLSAGPSSTKRAGLTPKCLPTSNTVISLSSEPAESAPDTPGQQSFTVDDFGDSTLDGIEIDEQDENLPPQTPTATIPSSLATAARTPLKPIENGILQGAVVFVDVHTSEGADASGIFVELLTQMGARCVRNWAWNPRASLAEVGHETESAQRSRIGITHVIFKDGGQRTLEKVRHAGGVVWCVGVGWVLDCERERQWLPESRYAIDTTILPRGGSRRRKSMEPRQFTNVNGSLSASRRAFSADMTPAMKAELVATPVRTVGPPAIATVLADTPDASSSIHSGFSTPTGVHAAAAAAAVVVATPTGHVAYDPAASLSPATPYYLAQGATLVQHTCPPKQTRRGLFPVSGRIEDQPDERVRARLEAARRKTMHWRPRVASPLGK